MTGRTMDNRENVMLKDLSIENWIVGGSAFILIFTIGCFVWFQFKMSTVEIYDSNQKVETQHIDETSDTENEEIKYIEIIDTDDKDTTGKNSTDIETIDDESTEVTSTQKSLSERVDVSAYAHRKQILQKTELELLRLSI